MEIAFLVIGIILGVALLLLIAAAFVMYFIAYSRELPAIGKVLLGDNMTSDMTNAAERVRVSLAHETEEYLKAHVTEEIHTTSFDGLKLVATLLKGDPKCRKVVIAIHGYHSSANWDFGGTIQFFHERGYHVLLPDCRAHGRSEGKLVGFGWLDRKDAVTWSKKMVRMFGAEAEILLIGVSMGGATVMMASGEENLPSEVKAIIEDCGFSSVMEQFEYMFPAQVKFLAKPVLFFDNLISLIFNKHALYSASSLKQLAKNTRPILFIHGEEDDFVPAYMLEKNYEAAVSEKDYMMVPGAKHAQSCDADPQAYQKKISDFLEQTVNWNPHETLVNEPKPDDGEEEEYENGETGQAETEESEN